MAKKSTNGPRLSPAQMVRPKGEVPAASVDAEGPRDLTEEYSYVVADLKRIGFIALAMLAIMLILVFVAV
jgi:hypothetical protein